MTTNQKLLSDMIDKQLAAEKILDAMNKTLAVLDDDIKDRMPVPTLHTYIELLKIRDMIEEYFYEG